MNKFNALFNINSAISSFNKNKTNDLSINNFAIHQLINAEHSYDSRHNHIMENIFNTEGLISNHDAKERLRDYYLYNHHDSLAKKNYDYLNENHNPLVKIKNPFIPTNQIKILNRDDIIHLAKDMKRTINYKPYGYKLIAHQPDIDKNLSGEHINYALRCLVNHGIKNKETNVLRKYHLAEARSLVSSLYLAPKNAQTKIKKQLASIGSIGHFPKYIDVVKIHTTDHSLNVTKPTVKDVDDVCLDMHRIDVSRKINQKMFKSNDKRVFRHRKRPKTKILKKELKKFNATERNGVITFHGKKWNR